MVYLIRFLNFSLKKLIIVNFRPNRGFAIFNIQSACISSEMLPVTNIVIRG